MTIIFPLVTSTRPFEFLIIAQSASHRSHGSSNSWPLKGIRETVTSHPTNRPHPVQSTFENLRWERTVCLTDRVPRNRDLFEYRECICVVAKSPSGRYIDISRIVRLEMKLWNKSVKNA